MTLYELCTKHQNEYIRLDFGSRETIAKGSDFLQKAEPALLLWEIEYEEDTADYYDIYARLL